VHPEELVDGQVRELERLGVGRLTANDLEAVSHVRHRVPDLVRELRHQPPGRHQPVSLNELRLESLEPRLPVLELPALGDRGAIREDPAVEPRSPR